MSTTIRRSAVSLAAIGVLALAVSAPAGAAGGRPFTMELTGAAEVPGPGDLDGSGTASLTINPGLGEVCWTIEVTDVDPILAAHIHLGEATVVGPVVVPLNPYTGGCTTVELDLARAIIQDPDAYYVNVHNAAFPAGALRAQLDR